jgi:hypothetical protein
LINFFSTPALSQPDRVDYLELVCVVTDVATLRRGVSWYALFSQRIRAQIRTSAELSQKMRHGCHHPRA